jgi:hypothetical protein
MTFSFFFLFFFFRSFYDSSFTEFLGGDPSIVFSNLWPYNEHIVVQQLSNGQVILNFYSFLIE